MILKCNLSKGWTASLSINDQVIDVPEYFDEPILKLINFREQR